MVQKRRGDQLFPSSFPKCRLAHRLLVVVLTNFAYYLASNTTKTSRSNSPLRAEANRLVIRFSDCCRLLLFSFNDRTRVYCCCEAAGCGSAGKNEWEEVGASRAVGPHPPPAGAGGNIAAGAAAGSGAGYIAAGAAAGADYIAAGGAGSAEAETEAAAGTAGVDTAEEVVAGGDYYTAESESDERRSFDHRRVPRPPRPLLARARGNARCSYSDPTHCYCCPFLSPPPFPCRCPAPHRS